MPTSPAEPLPTPGDGAGAPASPGQIAGRPTMPLPESHPYLANLSELWAIDPALAAAVEADDTVYAIEPAKSGVPTVKAPPTLSASPTSSASHAIRALPPVTASHAISASPTLSGPPTVPPSSVAHPAPGGALSAVYLHSRYDPAGEAQKLLAAVDASEHVAFAVHGLGLGYLLEALFAQASDEAAIVVFEPDLVMLRTAMWARDLSSVRGSGRVSIVATRGKPEPCNKLMKRSTLFALGMTAVSHPAARSRDPGFHEQMETWLAEFMSYVRTSLNTLVYNGTATATNVTRNIAWYAATSGLARLADRHKGKPAVIVSAGPSLRKNKHLLPQAAERAVIIGVQTTLKPLLEIGVEPDYITSLDYSEICTRFYEGLPPSLRTELVAEPKATDRIFDLFPGPVTLVGNAFADKLIREMGLARPRVSAGATQAHLAFYLAQYLGCDPIIFVGQDLGFSDGLCYAPGTSYDAVWAPDLGRFCTSEMKQWEQIARDRRILRRIPDIHGRAMYTEERLFTYLQHFERDFAASAARVIDATEGGAYKRGATVMTLAEALDAFARQPIDRGHADTWSADWSTLGRVIECLEKRKAEASRIADVSMQTMLLLQEVSANLGDHGIVNRAIARIDRLRAVVGELNATYELITDLSQETELARFSADRKIAAARLDADQRQARQVQRDIDNVRGVIKAAERFEDLMDQTIARLRERLDAPGSPARKGGLAA